MRATAKLAAMEAQRREVYRLAMDAIAAEYAGDHDTRYAVVGELYGHPAAAGGTDLVIQVGTIVAIAREIADATAQDPGEVLASLRVESARDQRAMNIETSLILAASVMHHDELRGTTLALENSGWRQARVEAARLAAQLLRGVSNGEAIMASLRREIESM